MYNQLKRIFLVCLSGLIFTACNNNAEGGYGDNLAQQIAAELGIDADSFARASVEQANERLSKRWVSDNGGLEIGTLSVDGERGRYLLINSLGSIGKFDSRSDAVFEITGVNDDGTIDIRFESGEVCLSDGGRDKRCSKSTRGSGTLTMYLSDDYPNNVGLYVDYATRGRDMRISSSFYYNGESKGSYGAVLSRK